MFMDKLARRLRPLFVRKTLSPEQVSKVITDFVDGTGGEWDWDDFVSVPLRDEELDAIRRRAAAVQDDFPSSYSHQYCSAAGLEELRRLAQMAAAVHRRTAD